MSVPIGLPRQIAPETRITPQVALRLRRLRRARQLAATEAARRSGMSLSRLEQIETGWFEVRPHELFNLCAALGADICEVWPDSP